MKNKPNQLDLFEAEASTLFQKGELDKEYFNLFKWALPLAFSEPLDYCYFEAGDFLYDTIKGYLSPWSEALKYVKHCIKVISPRRSETAKLKAAEDSIFKTNWLSPVEIELYTYENNEIKSKELIKTIQGVLYTFLWKGDFQLLRTEANPTTPLKGKSIKKLIDSESKEKIINNLKTNYNFTEAFVMFYDKSSPLLKTKFSSILEKVKHSTNLFTLLYGRPFTSSELEFVPTLQLVCILNSSPKEKSFLYRIVKESLYNPSKNKKNEKDQFKIDTHGIFLSQ